jgi:hypothetical protein
MSFCSLSNAFFFSLYYFLMRFFNELSDTLQSQIAICINSFTPLYEPPPYCMCIYIGYQYPPYLAPTACYSSTTLTVGLRAFVVSGWVVIYLSFYL